ncbi:AGE family epimerase/isomerase [Pseudomonas fulva]|uniref:AGE family epimerase/isomerase n=1 Tax=Pseudomonas fulva TaxID=47880 RepID=UPI0018ABD103|nr:AGE family epimerase/isomerase [Pseudomonas fulva]MBF8676949.1 AGE family epimerase/isomerase [Pseudomonas fulva]MBF8699312.1 AGE family epimerase/isomerase [Pseudomonas fulva]
MARSDSDTGWLHASLHRQWLDDQGQRLLDFSKSARIEAGFSALDDAGQLPPGASAQTIITARMTHTYALASARGLPGCRALAQHGITALSETLRDPKHGGWLPAAGDTAARKQAYVHAFVALAASTAVVTKLPGATALLEQALIPIEQHFWSEDEGVMLESFAADWTDEEDYRGANSNMHSLEMALAVADALDAPLWRSRALRIANRFVNELARSHGFRLGEHFDRQWRLLTDYHVDTPDDDLRPYGLTPGHFLEWSFLLLKLEAALEAQEGSAPSWLLESAVQLFERGVSMGWSVDGAPGMVYTVDWQDRPVIRNRPHWVMAEAIKAAWALFTRTGEDRYADWYRCFWDYADLYLVDRVNGSWHHEVDCLNRPSSRVYKGKADLYHAYQATLTGLVPLNCSVAVSLALPTHCNADSLPRESVRRRAC